MFSDALILHGPYDFSADHNEVKLELTSDILEATRFGHTTKVNTNGLPSSKASGTGWLQTDDSTTPKAVDYNIWNEIGATEKAYTLSPATTVQGVAYLGTALSASYKPEWVQGQLAKFSFDVHGNRKFTRGRLMLALASRSVTGASSEYQLGATSSTQKLVANLHVTAFSGTSLAVIVRSAALTGMGSPTTRITFTTATAVTSENKEVAGAITDQFFDISYTVTAATATFAVSLGIRS
jgi:hypothetical protein